MVGRRGPQRIDYGVVSDRHHGGVTIACQHPQASAIRTVVSGKKEAAVDTDQVLGMRALTGLAIDSSDSGGPGFETIDVDQTSDASGIDLPQFVAMYPVIKYQVQIAARYQHFTERRISLGNQWFLVVPEGRRRELSTGAGIVCKPVLDLIANLLRTELDTVIIEVPLDRYQITSWVKKVGRKGDR